MNEIKNESKVVRFVQADFVQDVGRAGDAVYEVYLELKEQYPQQILLIETSHPNGYVCFDDDAKTAYKIMGVEPRDFMTMFGVLEHGLNEVLEKFFAADADVVVCIPLDKNEE